MGLVRRLTEESSCLHDMLVASSGSIQHLRSARIMLDSVWLIICLNLCDQRAGRGAAVPERYKLAGCPPCYYLEYFCNTYRCMVHPAHRSALSCSVRCENNCSWRIGIGAMHSRWPERRCQGSPYDDTGAISADHVRLTQICSFARLL